FLANTQVNGPRTKMLALNYADSTQVSILKWADWCAPSQTPPDLFTWPVTHRLAAGGGDGNSCTLITKYVPVDPNRVLTSITSGTYTLSAAVRDGSGPGAGPQATPVTVKVEAGKTTTQDIALLASPNLNLWGELTGTVKDAAGNPVKGAAVLFSNSATGPFAA